MNDYEFWSSIKIIMCDIAPVSTGILNGIGAEKNNQDGYKETPIYKMFSHFRQNTEACSGPFSFQKTTKQSLQNKFMTCWRKTTRD